MSATGPGNNKANKPSESTSQTNNPNPAMDAAYQKAQQEQQAKAHAQAQAQSQQQTQQSAPQGNPQMSQQPAPEQPQYQSGTAMMESFRPRFNITDQGDADGSVLLATIRAIEEKAKATNGNTASGVQFHTLSKSKTGSFSAVLVTIPTTVNNQMYVGTQTLLMESSRAPLDNLTQQTPTGAIEIVLSPVDAFTPEFIALAHKEIARFYKNDALIIDAGLQVIYRETHIKDESAVAIILNEATQAIDATLRQLDPREKQNRFNLDKVVKNPTARIVSKFALDESAQQANGLPVRADITAELLMQQSSSKQQTIQTQTTISLAKAASYVDLIYTAPAQTFAGVPQYNTPGQQYHYIPRITLTELATDMAGSPMEFILLGVANMTSLNRNRSYGIQWRDSYNKVGQGSLRNLGALGWQMPHLNATPGNEGVPGNLAIESDQDLQRLINTAINPSPVYSLEVEQAGRNGWLLETFSQAALGNLAANRNVVDAADALTAGRFRAIYARNARVNLEDASSVQVIRATQDLNHIGYYKNPEGEYADLRELDLLAVLNIANGNIELVRDFLSTVVATTGEHPLQRLDKRLRIFRKICPEVVVKGYTTKYDFNAVFIQSLIEAIEATGFVLNATNTLLASQQQVYTQTVQDWANVMVDPSVGNGLYQAHTFTPQGQIYNVGQNMGFGYFR